MMSYWEQQSFSFYDHIVVGAGIVGLSTAIEIKQRFPGDRVLILERGLLPTGASSRNAGFACMGSVTELLDDLTTMSEDEVVGLFESRKKGLERLRNRLGDAKIGYMEQGSYELIADDELSALDQIGYLNKMLISITGRLAFGLANDKITVFGFSPSYAKALIQNNCEGGLHTGKMLRALTDFALSHGVEIITGAEVKRFEERSDGVEIEVQDPFRKEVWLLHSKTITVCTNAFSKQMFPDADVIPGRGQVLITKPVEGLKFKGIYHFDKGYYYFREIDGRVLIGGGRNLDFEGETTTAFSLTDTIQSELEGKLRDIILPGQAFEIDQRWSGIMAFGKNKEPIVKAFSDKVFGAFRMGGMGVALGSQVAVQVAGLIQNRD